MTKKSKLLLWVILSLLIISIGVFFGFNANFLILSLAGLVLYSILELLELILYGEKRPWHSLKTFCLILIFSGITIVQVQDVLKPEFPIREIISGDKVRFKNEESNPHKNVYFTPAYLITRPALLKIQDSYSYLAQMIDYDILNDRTVFINYMFGNNEATNKAIAEKGFDFVYFTRDWMWSRAYRQYKERRSGLKNMYEKLNVSSEKKGVQTMPTLKDTILNNFPPNYWWQIILFTLVIRLILSIFKAFAIRQGEADYVDEITEEKVVFRKWSWRKAYWKTVKGFSRGPEQKTIDDYWLTVLIGIAELYLYPILMVVGKWSVIGTWLAIKTASGWGTWHKTRTSYSRFLFGNILALLFSIFLMRFVK